MWMTVGDGEQGQAYGGGGGCDIVYPDIYYQSDQQTTCVTLLPVTVVQPAQGMSDSDAAAFARAIDAGMNGGLLGLIFFGLTLSSPPPSIGSNGPPIPYSNPMGDPDPSFIGILP